MIRRIIVSPFPSRRCCSCVQQIQGQREKPECRDIAMRGDLLNLLAVILFLANNVLAVKRGAVTLASLK